MNTTVEVSRVVHGGYGLARIEGQVCFVPGALPGDVVEIRVSERKRGVAWGAIVSIVEPSPDRVAADCPVFGRCGGCSWLHFAYPAQAEWKLKIVEDCLARIGRVQTELAIQEAPSLRRGYRTRARFHARNGQVGYYAEGSRDLTPVSACPLCHPRLNEALERVGSCAYDGDIEIVVNPEGCETLVWTKEPSNALRQAFPQPAELPGTRRPGFVFDGRPIVAGAFAQSSLLLNRLLIEVVETMAVDSHAVLDLYCGNGNLSLGLTGRCVVTGMDHNKPAVAAAGALKSGCYREGGERDFCASLRQGGFDTVILDPPRTGARDIMPALEESGAERIIYVSCDPATMARDVQALSGSDWRLNRAVAVDLFPHTPHVETVALLTR